MYRYHDKRVDQITFSGGPVPALLRDAASFIEESGENISVYGLYLDAFNECGPVVTLSAQFYDEDALPHRDHVAQWKNP